jgi:hypothetical protein
MLNTLLLLRPPKNQIDVLRFGLTSWEEFSGTVKLNGLSDLIYANGRRENAYELLRNI